MLTSFSPITNKVYRALVKIDVTTDTVEEAKKLYTHGILSVAKTNSIETSKPRNGSMFESYNLAYEECFVDFIHQIYILNSDKTVLVDTKINELDNVTLLRIITILDYRDKLLFLEMIRNACKSTFVTNDIKILEMLTRLATRNLLNSTYHFLSMDITVCCQPDLTFLVFVRDFDLFETCFEIASNANLDLCNLQVKC